MSKAIIDWLNDHTVNDLLIAGGVNHAATRSQLLGYLSKNDLVIQELDPRGNGQTRLVIGSAMLGRMTLKTCQSIAVDLADREAARFLRGARKRAQLKRVAYMLACGIGLGSMGHFLKEAIEDVKIFKNGPPQLHTLLIACLERRIEIIEKRS